MSSSSRLLAAGPLLGAIVLGTTLRFTGLDTQSYWLDESFTKLLADKDFGDMLGDLPDSESTPPLYYVLAWLWAQPFGSWEAGLRSLSALIGVATIPVAYLVAREVASRVAANQLALLAAVSPFLVWYSQEARSYALLILLAALTVLFTLRRSLLPWSIAAALALTTHYFAVFIVAAEVAWLYRAGLRRPLALACVPVAAVAAALVPLALDQRDNGGAGVGDASIADRLEDTAQEFLVGPYGGPVRGLGPLCALLVAVGLVLALRREDRRALAGPFAIGAATLALPLAAAVVGVDYFTPRHVALAWIPLLVVVAAGFAAHRASLLLGAALGVVFFVVTAAVPFTPRLQRDDWRGAARALDNPGRARTIVLSPSVGFVPLSVYREVTAPPGPTFPVYELDVLVMIRDGREPLRESPIPGFRLLETHRDASFVLSRFVVPHLQRGVDGAELRRIRLTPDPTGFVYEPGAR